MAGSDLYATERAVAAQLARQAGRLLLDMQGQTRQIDFKGRNDLVTDADRASERQIVTELAEIFPDDGILGEESGYNPEAASTNRLWVIDPLDGTTNYAHGFPIYAVSIGLIVDGVVEAGAVYVPPLDELFSASRGAGATLNDEPITPSSTDILEHALLCSGFSYDVAEREQNFEHWRRFVLRARAVRRIGSAAYDLCCVACGRFDGYWERGPSAWDLAAGSLIVSEAGGVVSDFELGAFDPFGKEILAAGSGIHRKMAGVLSG